MSEMGSPWTLMTPPWVPSGWRDLGVAYGIGDAACVSSSWFDHVNGPLSLQALWGSGNL